MNYNEMVIEYINNVGTGIPFFIDEIEEYIIENNPNLDKKNVYNNVKATLNRMNKDGKVDKSYNGVYYIPACNIFGKMAISNKDIINYKYIMDKKGNIKGYITGAKLFNDAHFTTQVPSIIDVATNDCKNYNKYNNSNLNVVIRKPKMKVDNENYKYLQLFDLIENKDNVEIEVENFDDALYKFIKANNLDFEKIIKYAMVTKSNNVINKILTIAR